MIWSTPQRELRNTRWSNQTWKRLGKEPHGIKISKNSANKISDTFIYVSMITVTVFYFYQPSHSTFFASDTDPRDIHHSKLTPEKLYSHNSIAEMS